VVDLVRNMRAFARATPDPKKRHDALNALKRYSLDDESLRQDDGASDELGDDDPVE
jgi:hypothetical protein